METGINVIGYFEGVFGLGQSARLIAHSLKTSKVPYCLLSADHLIPHHTLEKFDLPVESHPKYAVNLFCTDAEHIAVYMREKRFKGFNHQYNIGLFFWETDIIPKIKAQTWGFLDEIWVTSRYVQENVEKIAKIPVRHIPMPVILKQAQTSSSKHQFGLLERYTFLFSFDFFSVFKRKNPLAIIQAFLKAFPNDQGVQLVIKFHHGEQFFLEKEAMIKLIGHDDRILLRDEVMTVQDCNQLMNCADCYISLHRSEGFGLTMAEAMLLGKPVIATDYSGNLDFMNEYNSFLCSYRLVPVGKGSSPYPPNGHWADVDVDHAAYWMKFVCQNPDLAKEKAVLGRDSILTNHSLEAVGKKIEESLKSLSPTKKSRWLQWVDIKIRIKRKAAHLALFFYSVLCERNKKNDRI